ncbi:glycosyltransferase [Candidatus Nomurabacteria bacterium]|nr:glycosyltransferase [Candidatus Nomurabacteria bacterium]
MTITIAIPSYNKEAQIARCIESVLENASEIDNIILVDNCSTDKTFEIAKSYEPRITCIQNETNLGMSGNFNRCIELCKSDWLMIFHADDVMLPNAIEKYRTLIKKHPEIGLIHADSYTITEGDETTRTHHPRKTDELYAAGAKALTCPYGVCSAVMVKKEAYDKLGGFIESSLSSDVEMWARVASNYPVGSINEPTVVYYSSIKSTGPQSLVNRSIAEIKADWDNLTNQIASIYPEGEARTQYLKNIDAGAPGAYWTVIKANLRAKNWRNVIDGFKLIIVDYHGLWPLLKIIIDTIKRRTVSKFFPSSPAAHQHVE